MQLIIRHNVDVPLVLPIGYHHIIQSILFRALEQEGDYSSFLHDKGYMGKTRKYKLFTFGLLHGEYEIRGKEIVFTKDVMFEVRSVEPHMLQLLKNSLEKNGIDYLQQHYTNVVATLKDKVIEKDEILIRMISPICVYSTDKHSGKTYYYSPDEAQFQKQINENFRRKYEAYTGITVTDDICIESNRIHPKDKYVTKYKGFYINGWKGQYTLRGKRQYLDFLYQTGLGSKNSQGFGMFEVL